MLVSHPSPNMLNQIGLKPLIDVLIMQNLCDMLKLFLRRYSWLWINQLTLKISALVIDDVIKHGNGAGLDGYCKTTSKSISLTVLYTRKYPWAWMSLQIQTRWISRYPWISMCLYTMYISIIIFEQSCCPLARLVAKGEPEITRCGREGRRPRPPSSSNAVACR
jgi:hypothetical protein